MTLSRRRFVGAIAAMSAGSIATSAGGASPRLGALVRDAEPPNLLARAMAALNTNARLVRKRDVIGLVDFSASSGMARFQLVDIANGRVIDNHFVSHGRGSDPENTGFVQRLSNVPGSNASCSGSFLVADTYFGKHGRSRRLVGLDPENSMALERAIVIHGADYVSDAMARDLGRVGRSQGCFAVSRDVIGQVLDRLGPGHLLYAGK